MKNIMIIGFLLLSIAVSAQSVKLGECKNTQEYLKQAMAYYYIPQWNTLEDSVNLHWMEIEKLSDEIEKITDDFMKNKYTDEYLSKSAQEYATKLGGSPETILALGEACESIQATEAKLLQLYTELESNLGKLSPLEDIYKEYGLDSRQLFFSGEATKHEEIEVAQNRKIYNEQFPHFYNKALVVQKQVSALRKSFFEEAFKLQCELVSVLQQKYDASKLMMLEHYLDQQKGRCYLLIKEYAESLEELYKPYQMYKLRHE